MYYITQIEDITERKRLERDLRLSEARSSRIVSISADAIISIDENQCITLFNEGAEKIFGYSNGEAIGAQLEMLIPERFRATHREHVARFAGSEETARRMGYRDTAIFGLRKAVRNFRRTQPFRSWMSVANAS
jgi:PAS domain S-box-containing protein